MSGYATQIMLAFVAFPFIAALALFPYVVAQYRRRGRVGFTPALLASGFAIYLVGLVLLVSLPIPEFAGDFCATRASRPQLKWFQTIADIRRIERREPGMPLVDNPAFQVRAYNVALFVPLGMFLRHLFGRSVPATVLIGFLGSLAIELTQLTGVWWLFPCPWRTFDVDDLWSNTLGALLGALAAPVLRLLPGQKEHPATEPRPVTGWRRLLGMACDAVLVVLVGQGTLLALRVYSVYLGHVDERLADRLAPWLGWWLPGGLLLMLLPLLNGGRSPGQWAVLLHPVRPDGAPAPRWRTLVQVVAGPGLLLALITEPLPFTGPLLTAAVAVTVVLAFVGDHRGLSGWAAGLAFADSRPAPPGAVG
ncbi:VanZ family protein [Spirillospora sp. NPDC050679]